MVQYQRSLTKNLRNWPKNIDHSLMRKSAVDHAMIRSMEPINGTCYYVEKL